MHHGPELAIVLLVCFTLLTGALLTTFARKVRLPYTIAVLLAGLAIGLLLTRSDAHASSLLGMLGRGASLSPDLIIFVFLPVLVFESAFSLEVHAFRKNVGPVLLLSGPALLVCTFATGAMMVALTAPTWGWGWVAALAFGALISATDPVAVVALLRGLGAPKRLGLLIEGESLLNDGTAIVVFGLLLELLTGEHGEVSALGTLGHFVYVAGGGAVVGLVLAAAVSGWLAKTFNAPMVEITLTLMLAYLAMVVAEGILHVSGVIAVVTAGLWMSGPGRVHISPEVRHFLHHFWGMLSHLANTLIFFLVGMVVARHLSSVTLSDVALILATYLGIMAIRALAVGGSRPLMNRIASPVSKPEAAVMTWGGLRGAVSLALALVVSQHPDLPQALREQVLLLTAGVVLLTVVVNGATMPWLLRRFGLDRPPAGDRLAEYATRAGVLERVADRITPLRDEPELRTVDWNEVDALLHRDRTQLGDLMAGAETELDGAGPEERERSFWRRVLRLERAAVWNAFYTGLLGRQAVQFLDHELDLQHDRLAGGDTTPPARRYHQEPQSPWLRRILSRLPLGFGRLPFERLSRRYDLLRGEGIAAKRVLAGLDDMASDVDEVLLETARRTYRSYELSSKEELEDLRANLPELTTVLETRLARRIALNLERDIYGTLEREGAIDPDAASSARATAEDAMKMLLARPAHEATIPETADLCRHAPLFQGLSSDALDRLAVMTEERVLSPGEVLVEEGAPSDSMFIVARGALGVYRRDRGEQPLLLEVLGGGEVLGEMSLLDEAPRNATLRALTTVTVGEVSRADFLALMRDHPRFCRGVWEAFVARRFDNHVRQLADYEHLSHDERLGWLAAGRILGLAPGATVEADPDALLFLAHGRLRVGEASFEASTLLPVDWGRAAVAETEARVAVLPRWERVLAERSLHAAE